MQQIVMAVCSISILLSFSGCTCKTEVQVVKVPQKCIVPYTPPPKIDNGSYGTFSGIASKALLNYNAVKEYSEKLLAAQEVCK